MIEQIAIVCHEANAAYCRTIGDDSQPSWGMAAQWQRDSAIKGVTFHLNELSAGREPSPSASHEEWLQEKEAAGWKFGSIKNADTKEHPCFLPYGELAIEQRRKDYIFAAICKAFHESEA